MRRLTKISLRYLAVLLFVLAGSLHFLKPDGYMKIMPVYVKWPMAMIYFTGAAEIAGGLGLLLPQTRRLAAWGLVLLLICVFPANVHMAAHNIQVTAKPIPQSQLWARLAIQPLLIFWVLWCSEE